MPLASAEGRFLLRFAALRRMDAFLAFPCAAIGGSYFTFREVDAMCGRYTLRTPLNVLAQQFLFELGDLPPDLKLAPRYNIAPTQTVAVVRRLASGGPRQLALVHWGLIPSWAKDAKSAAGMINA